MHLRLLRCPTSKRSLPVTSRRHSRTSSPRTTPRCLIQLLLQTAERQAPTGRPETTSNNEPKLSESEVGRFLRTFPRRPVGAAGGHHGLVRYWEP
uniref:Uncharacterized protein n=1 Tax=Macrostomum lignano TaxID=282301 RepID=A0A1I8FPQ7_9PLAT